MKAKEPFIKTKDFKSRPFRNELGDILNDVEVLKRGISEIESYEKEHGEPVPNISPQFIDFCKDLIKACDEGTETPSSYKKRNVVKTVDYDVICKNTEKLNKENK